MDTHDLIENLAANAPQRTASILAVWWGAVGLSVVAAALVFFAVLGPRPDFALALETPRFLSKFAVAAALAVSAFFLARALSRPGETRRGAVQYLMVAPGLVAMAVLAELLVSPPATWPAKALGTNSLVCLTYITMIGIGPLGIFLLALRHGAATRPVLSGGVAGLLAGGIAAIFYAAHCNDDSPLFVAVWYTAAVGILALLGGALAQRFCRW